LLFFPAFIAAYLFLPAMWGLPQAVTNQVMLWALVGALVSWMIGRFMVKPAAGEQSGWLRSIVLAILTVAVGYLALWLVDALFMTDIRFWVVAVKLPSLQQWGIAAIYVVPLTLAFLMTVKSLGDTTVCGDSAMKRYIAAILGLNGGLIVMLSLIYGIFFATGNLVTAFDPLSTVIAIQFVPVLTAIGIVGIFAWQRTNSHRAGGVLAGLLVTLYVVAGTATQVEMRV